LRQNEPFSGLLLH